ncbi:hypothetical protein [Bacillus sp. 7894-2]|uniref:hypothetical protein n=1 Tax=Bacillus sp. 7894-2 TaxID=2021695 RepID=UPI000BA5A93E|nr:hypothetical protein [Bacillus sp. 7894-2]PAE25803.1 hypothetical protein CHI10_05845 [Bacillus sp. 7894-2]
MCSYNDELDFIMRYFQEEVQPDSKTKELGLRLIDMVIQLRLENHYLKEKIIKADQDFEWVEKKADEWMLKAMENSELNKP